MSQLRGSRGRLPGPHPPPVETPAPTEDPPPTGPPAIADLVIRPDGIGPRVIGTDTGLVDDESSIVHFVEAYCEGVEYDAGGSPDGASDDARLPAEAYFLQPEDPTKSVFSLGVVDGTVVGVDVIGTSPITTEEGIAPGSSLDEFLAAHPEAALALDGPISDVYEVRDGENTLVFEVVTEPFLIEATPRPEVDRPVGIISARLHAECEVRSRWATDDVFGACG